MEESDLINKKNIISSIYDRNEEKESNFIINARISISNIVDYLIINSNLRTYEIKKSPFSDSLYLELLCIDDKFDHIETYTLRFSDHYCNGYSNSLILNFVEDSGLFCINKMLLKIITKNQIEKRESIEKSIFRFKNCH